MSKKLITHGEIKIVSYFEPKSISVRLATWGEEWYEIEKYLVAFDNSEQSFQYDWSKFYLDEYNHKLMDDQREKHSKEAEDMKQEWKTEEEIREHLKGKWTQFIDRVEVIMNDNIYSQVNDLISKL